MRYQIGIISHGGATALLLIGASMLVLAPAAPSQRRGKRGRQAQADVAPVVAAALPTYRKYLARLPFLMHTRGREKLAKTGHPDALRILSRSYGEKWMDTPVDQHNYLLVAICAAQFQQLEHLDLFAEWRASNDRAVDSWLWFKTLQVEQQKMQSLPIMHYCGPYRNWYRLTDDVERMNLFRKVEIQCIAIGDVQVGALDRLARLGMGRAHNMGR